MKPNHKINKYIHKIKTNTIKNWHTTSEPLCPTAVAKTTISSVLQFHIDFFSLQPFRKIVLEGGNLIFVVYFVWEAFKYKLSHGFGLARNLGASVLSISDWIKA